MILDLPGFGQLDVRSVAGRATRVLVPKYKAVFDLGENDDAVLRTPTAFITHTHTDHVSGIWQHSALRGLTGTQRAHYYVPEDVYDRVEQVLCAIEEIEFQEMPRRLFGLKAFDGVRLAPELTVLSYPVHHVIPSTGYVVMESHEDD